MPRGEGQRSGGGEGVQGFKIGGDKQKAGRDKKRNNRCGVYLYDNPTLASKLGRQCHESANI
jgi:hypothetical protein